MIPSLWICADLGHPNAASLVDRVSSVLALTPACVWLRSPEGTPARALLTVARALRSITRDRRGALLVGDRVDVAALADADGVHLTTRSLPTSEVRSRFSLAISVATHDERSVREAAPLADALVLSPFGAVEGKGPALGRDGFARLRALAGETPVVALGGILTADDARSALDAGADGVALRRSLLDVDDPAAACAEIARALPRRWLTSRAVGENTTRVA